MATKFKGFIVPTVNPVPSAELHDRMVHFCNASPGCSTAVGGTCKRCIFNYDKLTTERRAAFEEWEKTQ